MQIIFITYGASKPKDVTTRTINMNGAYEAYTVKTETGVN